MVEWSDGRIFGTLRRYELDIGFDGSESPS